MKDSVPPLHSLHFRGLMFVVLVVKNLPANAGDTRDVGLILGLGRSPGGGHDYPLQYPCLESPMNRGAWRATVLRVAESRTRLKWFSSQMWRVAWMVQERRGHLQHCRKLCPPPVLFAKRLCVSHCCFRNVLWSPESGRGLPCLLRVLFVDCGRFDGKNELDWLTLICRIRLERLPQEELSRGVMTKATRIHLHIR